MRVGYVVWAFAVLVVVAGCQRPPVEAPEAEVTPTPAEPEAAEQACGPLEFPPEQGGDHLIGDREPPVAYSSTPPTSGWHASGPVHIGVHEPDEPLPEPRQVSVLEAGAAVVTYRDLDGVDREALEALILDRFPGRAAVTPYDKLEPGEVAMAAWGVLQRCERLDLEAVATFVDEHTDVDPEATH